MTKKLNTSLKIFRLLVTGILNERNSTVLFVALLIKNVDCTD